MNFATFIQIKQKKQHLESVVNLQNSNGEIHNHKSKTNIQEVILYAMCSPILLPIDITYNLFVLYGHTFPQQNRSDLRQGAALLSLLWPITLPMLGFAFTSDLLTGAFVNRQRLKMETEQITQRIQAEKRQKDRDDYIRCNEEYENAIIQIKQLLQNEKVVICDKCNNEIPVSYTYQCNSSNGVYYECIDCDVSLEIFYTQINQQEVTETTP